MRFRGRKRIVLTARVGTAPVGEVMHEPARCGRVQRGLCDPNGSGADLGPKRDVGAAVIRYDSNLPPVSGDRVLPVDVGLDLAVRRPVDNVITDLRRQEESPLARRWRGGGRADGVAV